MAYLEDITAEVTAQMHSLGLIIQLSNEEGNASPTVPIHCRRRNGKRVYGALCRLVSSGHADVPDLGTSK